MEICAYIRPRSHDERNEMQQRRNDNRLNALRTYADLEKKYREPLNETTLLDAIRALDELIIRGRYRQGSRLVDMQGIELNDAGHHFRNLCVVCQHLDTRSTHLLPVATFLERYQFLYKDAALI